MDVADGFFRGWDPWRCRAKILLVPSPHAWLSGRVLDILMFFLLVIAVNSDLNHQRSGNGRSSSVSKPHFHHVSARELRKFSNVLISPRHALHSSHLHQGTSSTWRSCTWHRCLGCEATSKGFAPETWKSQVLGVASTFGNQGCGKRMSQTTVS